MTRIIITAIGSAGDVHPLLGIGRALAARGHRIVFCSHAPFEAAACRFGFEFVPVGTEREYVEAMANPALWNPRTSFRTLWGVLAPIMRPHYDKLRELVDQDTVLVGTLWAFSARMLQERQGLPYVSVQLSPSTLLSAYAPPVHKRLTIPKRWPYLVKFGLMRLIERAVLDKACGPKLNAVRADLGLPPARRILGHWLHSPDGVLCLFPDWYAAPQPDWPTPHLLSGFPLFNEVGEAAPDAELEAFLAAGEPPVVFTAGSTQIDAAAYRRAVEHALKATGARGLLLAADEDTVPASPHLVARRYVPMRALLPRCRALVHHGGVGTASLAYEAGIPQVVTPFAHDQFDNAQRVEDSGCGVRLDSPIGEEALAQALIRVLGDKRMSEQCRQMRARMAAAPDGCEAAADFIERLVPRAARRVGGQSAGLPAVAATVGVQRA